jgi:glutathione S-transferase
VVYSHPSLENEITILESALVVYFFVDMYPTLSKRISPPPSSPETAYLRYRTNFFVDTYVNKVHGLYFKVFLAHEKDAESRVDDLVNTIREHIEPLLHDAGPFFGGSSHMTLAEVRGKCNAIVSWLILLDAHSIVHNSYV